MRGSGRPRETASVAADSDDTFVGEGLTPWWEERPPGSSELVHCPGFCRARGWGCSAHGHIEERDSHAATVIDPPALNWKLNERGSFEINLLDTRKGQEISERPSGRKEGDEMA